jgi:hypothetical protein
MRHGLFSHHDNSAHHGVPNIISAKAASYKYLELPAAYGIAYDAAHVVTNNITPKQNGAFRLLII